MEIYDSDKITLLNRNLFYSGGSLGKFIDVGKKQPGYSWRQNESK